jgi:CRISPR-associated protein (TIGR02584 family)
MKKEIFIFIVGTTPQIATETLYALHHKNPPIHPDEILIITTVIGKKGLKKTL